MLTWSRTLGAGLARRAAVADGVRLAAHRLAADLRQAGFGLASSDPAVNAAGPLLELRFADGGFDGGTPVLAPAPPGQDFLAVAAVGDMQPGDQVLLRDRLARELVSRVTYRDAVRRQIGIADPLPFPALPEAGARLYRIVRREWRLAPDGLRRDGQPALDAPAGLRTAVAAAAGLDGVLGWLAAPAPGPPPAAGAPALTAVRLQGGDPFQAIPLGPGRARPERAVTLLLLVGPRQPVAAAASPLP
jgi:hypothetical protein